MKNYSSAGFEILQATGSCLIVRADDWFLKFTTIVSRDKSAMCSLLYTVIFSVAVGIYPLAVNSISLGKPKLFRDIDEYFLGIMSPLSENYQTV